MRPSKHEIESSFGGTSGRATSARGRNSHRLLGKYTGGLALPSTALTGPAESSRKSAKKVSLHRLRLASRVAWKDECTLSCLTTACSGRRFAPP